MIVKEILTIALVLISKSQIGSADPYDDPHFYPNRSGIVQLFEWPFVYIARECEQFLGPRGFAGVQTSPVHETRIMPGRPWYELYQPISYKINNRLGNEKQFRDMVGRCNKAGIRIYVDAILNHMSDEGETPIVKGKSGSIAAPQLFLFPAVPYSKSDFHPTCDTQDWNDRVQFRNCRLLTLPDLDQSKPHVRKQLVKMMNYLLDLGVAGFRIDASSFMDPDDLKVIVNRLKDLNTQYNFASKTRPFIYHEAHSWKYDYVDNGRVIEYSYSFFLTQAMRGNYPIKNYAGIGETWGLIANESSVVDIDNHDSQRSFNHLTFREPIQFRMATAFMLSFPYGIPKMISSFNYYSNITAGPPADEYQNIIDPAPGMDGQCQDNWNCEHRYKGMPEMVEFSNIVKGESVEKFVGNDDGQAGFCRGNKGFIAFNTGKKDMEMEMDVCLPKGTYCDISSGNPDGDYCAPSRKCKGRQIVVDENGKAIIRIGANDENRFLAIHEKSFL